MSASNDKQLILWDVATGEALHHLNGHNGWVRTVAFAPDGQTAVAGGFNGDSIPALTNPGELILWDLETGAIVKRLQGHTNGVQTAAFTPDGQSILAASGFMINGEVNYSLILWDVASGQPQHEIEVGSISGAYEVAIFPDGQTALSASGDRGIHRWHLATGEDLEKLQGHSNALITAVRITPDGSRAVSADADGQIILWDLKRGTPLLRSDLHEPLIPGWFGEDPPPVNLALSGDGRTLLSAAGDGTLVQWDITDAAEINRLAGPAQIWGLALTPDDRWALTGTWGDGFGLDLAAKIITYGPGMWPLASCFTRFQVMMPSSLPWMSARTAVRP